MICSTFNYHVHGLNVRDFRNHDLQDNIKRIRGANSTAYHHHYTFDVCINFVDRSQIARICVVICCSQRRVVTFHVCCFSAELKKGYFFYRCFDCSFVLGRCQAIGGLTFVRGPYVLCPYAFRAIFFYKCLQGRLPDFG